MCGVVRNGDVGLDELELHLTIDSVFESKMWNLWGEICNGTRSVQGVFLL